MKKRIGQKVIVIIGLILISTQIIYPLDTNAAAKLNWENPNQGKNPYKFKLSDYLNSQMVMQVIGCTGVVDKISGTMGDLMRGDLKSIGRKWESNKAKIKRIQATSQELMKALGVSMLLKDPGPALTNVATDQINDLVETKNLELEREVEDLTNKIKANKMRDECLNGIAFTLAKNQLTAMTKQTMNWVTSGFNGDPMYVRNVNSFMNSIENEIIYKELDIYKDLMGNYASNSYPYARDYASSYINSRQSALNFADSTKQDLTNYLTEGTTIEEYSNDFSKGGWYGWLGLTQHSQNNPLGFTMMASQNTADEQEKEIENTKNEIEQGDGIISQKKCVVKAITKKAGQIKIEKTNAANAVSDTENKYTEENYYYEEAKKGNDPEAIKDAYDMVIQAKIEMEEAKANFDSLEASIQDMTDKDECVKWEIITPGSLIRDKVSNYLGSPERQLEMADSINEVLSVLFAKLIDKLRLDGLSSLNSESFNNGSGGFGSNSWTTPVDFTDVDGNKYTGTGFDENRSFDLTKDLGNIYSHNETTNLGNWDAIKNTTNPDKAIELQSSLVFGKGQINTFYVVTKKGNTRLFDDGYNFWETGDRAFFDGTSWQNWKCGSLDNKGNCTKQISPIIKRGVIQLQEDYLVGAKELLKTLPGVMPALGELDYCIPGPNPNWQANSVNAYEAFSDYVSGIRTDYTGASGFLNLKRDYIEITTPDEDPNGEVYKKYKSIFDDSVLWKDNGYGSVEKTSIFTNIVKLGKRDRAKSATEEIYEQNLVITTISDAFERLEKFNKEYPKMLSEAYGTMQDQYLEYEEKSTLHPFLKTENTSYLPMVKKGLTITKKMLVYDEEINAATKDLVSSINETESNIHKLELIKNEVAKIISQAQDRRALKKAEIIDWIIVNNKLTGQDASSQAEKIYNSCLDEENINYLDYEKIIITEETGTRCSDKVDNDFDGLLDEKDPDCGSSTERARTSGGTTSGGSTTGTGGDGGSYYDNNNPSSKYYSEDANFY